MRETKMNTQKTKLGAAFATVLVAMVMLTPTVSAMIPMPPGAVYYGYGEATDMVGQVFRVWITVNTVFDTITVRWEGHPIAFHMGLPGIGGFTGCGVWDDKGYNAFEVVSTSGTITFRGYTNSYTWVYAELRWLYGGAWWFFIIRCGASVRIWV